MIDKSRIPEEAKVKKFNEKLRNKFLVWRMLHPNDHVCHHCARTNPKDKDCGCRQGYYMEFNMKHKDGEEMSACVRFLLEGNYVK
jgi:hypothetical protein